MSKYLGLQTAPTSMIRISAVDEEMSGFEYHSAFREQSMSRPKQTKDDRATLQETLWLISVSIASRVGNIVQS